MALNEEKGKEIVQKIVNGWSKVYINQVFFKECENGTIWKYEIEFSQPKNTKPIPEGTVKVQFSLREIEVGQPPEIEFNFESESLRHRIGNTMRDNMYESWVNTVLDKKLKIKTELHLGTEFEYTRFVDEKGQTVDPFVPQFDIMKVKQFDQQRKDSQKINVESPRFISTLKRALEQMFTEADRDNTGKLSYTEFRESFRILSYGLNDNDINMLIALADENKDELIDWHEFIPIGIEAIKTFFVRKLAKKSAQSMKHPNPNALKLVYWEEIQNTYRLLQHKFQSADTDKNGKVSIDWFKNIVRDTKFLTPKEKNLLIRLQKSDSIEYANFPDLLYQVRYEIAQSEMMEAQMGDLEAAIVREFATQDTDDSGDITVRQCEVALHKCKALNLTPFQIHVLLGLSDCDSDGKVPYKEFARVCVDYIDEQMKFSTLLKKSQIMQNIKKSDTPIVHPQTESLDEMELFRTFKKYDRNMNGTLDFNEYTQCLAESPAIDLTKQEIITMAMTADLNGDGLIDFEEFMKHYKQVLNLIEYNAQLDHHYSKYLAAERSGAIDADAFESIGLKTKNETEKVRQQL